MGSKSGGGSITTATGGGGSTITTSSSKSGGGSITSTDKSAESSGQPQVQTAVDSSGSPGSPGGAISALFEALGCSSAETLGQEELAAVESALSKSSSNSHSKAMVEAKKAVKSLLVECGLPLQTFVRGLRDVCERGINRQELVAHMAALTVPTISTEEMVRETENLFIACNISKKKTITYQKLRRAIQLNRTLRAQLECNVAWREFYNELGANESGQMSKEV